MAASPSPEKKKDNLFLVVLAAAVAPFVLFVPFVEWIPWFENDDQRRASVIGLVVLTLVGYVAGQVLARRRRARLKELEADIAAADERLREIEPDASLTHVSDALFNDGAWRLSIYAKRADDENGEWLERLVSASSDKDLRSGSPARILIRDSIFREVFATNLANGLYRRPRESGPFTDAGDSFDRDAWLEWRDSIFGGPGSLPGADTTMTTRKYVWYATQDPETKQVLVALAESSEVNGVQVDFLAPPATSAWIVMAARMAGARAEIEPKIKRGKEAMGLSDD